MDMNSYQSMASAVVDTLKRDTHLKGVSQAQRLVECLEHQSAKAVSDTGFDIVRNDTELSPDARNAIWWASQALKKFRGYGTFDQDRLSKEATDGFLERNLSLKGQRLPWYLRDRVRELLREALPESNEGTGRFGPGAVAEGLDSVQRWTCFEDCDFSPRNPCLPGSSSFFQDDQSGQPFLSLPALRPDRPFDAVARLVAVPKDAWRMRLISVEPCRNSFLQQYTRSLMMSSIHKGCLRGTPSDFLAYRDNVEVQQSRCVRSSQTLRTSTIDLKDASDHICAEDVFTVFPPWLLPWLEMSRTPYVSAPGYGEHRLWMYGGMGNATTFLVETLYFWAVFTAIGAYLRVSNPGVSVFGDDIILNTAVVDHGLFEHLLDEAHIVLNRTKSCYGPGVRFREACGVAAYDGKPLHRLIRIQAPGVGRRGDVGICNLANCLYLSPLSACRSLADDIFFDIASKVPVVRASPRILSSPIYGQTKSWVSPCCNVLFREDGAPPHEVPTVRYRRDTQNYEIKADVIVGSNRIYWRRNLRDLEALGVIGTQIQTIQRKARTGLICPRPYHERVVRRWLPIE